MLRQFFDTARRRNRAIADAIYARIVAAARQPVPYSHWSVPDTPLGRYEMVGLHLYLVLRRLRGEGSAAEALAQELADTFFLDMDHSLRELGIGDMGIPKRMKTLARMFYGRTKSYDQALDQGDAEALAASLARNVRPDIDAWPQAAALARYANTAAAGLAVQDLAAILAGNIEFPAARSEEVGT